MEQIIIAGDRFVRTTAKNVYFRISNCFGATRYETTIASADKYSNNNPFMLTRITNAIQRELNASINCPKMIVLILEEDLIDEIGEKDRKKASIYFEIYVRFIIREINNMVEKFRHLLPENAKQDGWPKIVLIEPSVHRNYDYEMLRMRQDLGEVLRFHSKGKNDVWAMQLIQIWNKNDINLVKPENNKITQEGIIALWKAIDRTIRFCDKKMIRAEAALDNNPFKAKNPVNHQNDGQEEWEDSRLQDDGVRRRLPPPSSMKWTKPG